MNLGYGTDDRTLSDVVEGEHQKIELAGIRRGLRLIVNAEGFSSGLPHNRRASRLYSLWHKPIRIARPRSEYDLFGPVVIARVGKEGQFKSLGPSQTGDILRMLRK